MKGTACDLQRSNLGDVEVLEPLVCTLMAMVASERDVLGIVACRNSAFTEKFR